MVSKVKFRLSEHHATFNWAQRYEDT